MRLLPAILLLACAVPPTGLHVQGGTPEQQAVAWEAIDTVRGVLGSSRLDFHRGVIVVLMPEPFCCGLEYIPGQPLCDRGTGVMAVGCRWMNMDGPQVIKVSTTPVERFQGALYWELCGVGLGVGDTQEVADCVARCG